MQFVLGRRLRKNSKNHLARGLMDRHSLNEMIGKLMINTVINGHAGFQSGKRGVGKEGMWVGGVLRAFQAKPAYTCWEHKAG